MSKFSYEVKCACCGETFKAENKKTWKWQLDHEFFCSYKCYSKVFDSKYKASSVGSRIRIGYKTDKTTR